MVLSSYRDREITFHHSIDEHPVQENFPLHTHECCEFFVFLGGIGIYHVEGNSYPLKAGDILIMRRNESHYIEISAKAPYERMAIHFSDSLFDSFDTVGELLAPFYDRGAGTDNMISSAELSQNLVPYCMSLLKSGENKTRVEILSALIPLLREISLRKTEKKDRADNGEYPFSYQVIRYINEHLFDDLSLDSIAEHFFVSKATLSRTIKSSTGSSPGNYIRMKRLYCAKTMLKNGQKPHDVCFACGFRDYSAFYRAYKSLFFVSPGN